MKDSKIDIFKGWRSSYCGFNPSFLGQLMIEKAQVNISDLLWAFYYVKIYRSVMLKIKYTPLFAYIKQFISFAQLCVCLKKLFAFY